MPVLPKDLILNSSERQEISRHITELSRFLSTDDPYEYRGQVLSNDAAVGAMIAALLHKGWQPDAATAASLTEDYLDALEDLPAWCVREAIRKWNRGESTKTDQYRSHDFSKRAEPPVLRKLAYFELYQVKGRVIELKRLLDAVELIEYSEEHCAAMRERLRGLFHVERLG